MKLFSESKKGQFGLNQLSSAAIAVVVFIIVVAIGITVLAQVQVVTGDLGCDQINVGTAYNSTGNNCCFSNGTCYGANVATNLTVSGSTGMSLFGSFTSIIVLVAIAAVVLALIAVAFRAFQ